MKYEKPPLSTDDHINLLIGRGLAIPDVDKAKRYLSNIGYYRLTGYMYHLQERDGSHTFKKGIEFDHIISHYHFDKELRLLISDYLERVEVALRAKLIDHFCRAYGFFWYCDMGLYADQENFDVVNEEIDEGLKRSQELYVKSYRRKYDEESKLPCNMALELLSFGKLSKLYAGLKNGKEKRDIAAEFGMVSSVLSSWLIHFTNVRNVCAHHSRLWNRKFTANQPQIPNKKEHRFKGDIPDNFSSSMYGVIALMDRILKAINPGNSFISHFTELIDKFPEINYGYMGFPKDWRNDAVWNR